VHKVANDVAQDELSNSRLRTQRSVGDKVIFETAAADDTTHVPMYSGSQGKSVAAMLAASQACRYAGPAAAESEKETADRLVANVILHGVTESFVSHATSQLDVPKNDVGLVRELMTELRVVPVAAKFVSDVTKGESMSATPKQTSTLKTQAQARLRAQNKRSFADTNRTPDEVTASMDQARRVARNVGVALEQHLIEELNAQREKLADNPLFAARLHDLQPNRGYRLQWRDVQFGVLAYTAEKADRLFEYYGFCLAKDVTGRVVVAVGTILDRRLTEAEEGEVVD